MLFIHSLSSEFRESVLNHIEECLFHTDSKNNSLVFCLNSAQFYFSLLDLKDVKFIKSTIRIFIAKCFYFYPEYCYPLIYQALLYFPDILPKNNFNNNQSADVLISTIQCILMNTYYGSSPHPHLKMVKLYNLLRHSYKYDSKVQTCQELIESLIFNLKSNKTKNIALCVSLSCKRKPQSWVVNSVIEPYLLPLLTEYYLKLYDFKEHDNIVACIIESMSTIIKSFDITTNIDKYLNIFSQILNSSEHMHLAQNSAFCGILRLSRFSYYNCYNLIKLCNLKKIKLNVISKSLLKTFLYQFQLKNIK